MSFKMINESFNCDNCGFKVEIHPEGSARNHCPKCLYSKHLDENFPGDRASNCHGMMLPVGIDFKKNKGTMIKHRCTQCRKEMLNKLAPDDDFLSFQQYLTKNQ